MSKLVLFHPAAEQIGVFLADVTDMGMYIVSVELAGAHTQQLLQWMLVSGLFVIGVLAFLALVLMAFAASVRAIVTKEMRVLQIRRMYGATLNTMTLRIGTFIALVVVVIPSPMLTIFAMCLDF